MFSPIISLEILTLISAESSVVPLSSFKSCESVSQALGLDFDVL